MKVLAINTYAGSMLLGAKAFGAELVGSYEDTGFGQPIAQANFPDIPHIQKLADWPRQSLKGITVLAHPPCSAFSVQNSSWNARGENSEAFACTRRVLDYALEAGADSVAIESVIGALGGAWYTHQGYADRFGYYIYRILQNGCMFGTAQWRERFWAVYVRKDLTSPSMRLRLKPKWSCVRDVIGASVEGRSPGNNDALLEKFRTRFIEKGLTPEQMSLLFDKQDPPHPTAGIAKIMKKHLFPDDDINDIMRIYMGNCFGSGQLCYVCPDTLAGVLPGSSWWYYEGRNMSESAYKRIMGFPVDYIFPEKPRNYRKDMRTYLSKGVIPAVATWILGIMATHLGQHHPLNDLRSTSPDPCPCRSCTRSGYDITIGPYEIADFRFPRKLWMKEELPRLRHEDE